jgi:PAS domain S-box-containing protein
MPDDRDDGAWRASLLNALTAGVFVLDASASIVEINDSFVDVLGYGREGLPYHPPYPWFPDAAVDPRDHARAVQVLSDFFSSDGAGRRRIPQWHRDGRKVWIELSTASLPERLAPGRKVVGIARDVTAVTRTAQRDLLLAETGRLLTQPGPLADACRAVSGPRQPFWTNWWSSCTPRRTER